MVIEYPLGQGSPESESPQHLRVSDSVYQAHDFFCRATGVKLTGFTEKSDCRCFYHPPPYIRLKVPSCKLFGSLITRQGDMLFRITRGILNSRSCWSSRLTCLEHGMSTNTKQAKQCSCLSLHLHEVLGKDIIEAFTSSHQYCANPSGGICQAQEPEESVA